MFAPHTLPSTLIALLALPFALLASAAQVNYFSTDVDRGCPQDRQYSCDNIDEGVCCLVPPHHPGTIFTVDEANAYANFWPGFQVFFTENADSTCAGADSSGPDETCYYDYRGIKPSAVYSCPRSSAQGEAAAVGAEGKQTDPLCPPATSSKSGQESAPIIMHGSDIPAERSQIHDCKHPNVLYYRGKAFLASYDAKGAHWDDFTIKMDGDFQKLISERRSMSDAEREKAEKKLMDKYQHRRSVTRDYSAPSREQVHQASKEKPIDLSESGGRGEKSEAGERAKSSVHGHAPQSSKHA